MSMFIQVESKKGSRTVDTDEHPRPDSSKDK
jgi:hypothetical protein